MEQQKQEVADDMCCRYRASDRWNPASLDDEALSGLLREGCEAEERMALSTFEGLPGAAATTLFLLDTAVEGFVPAVVALCPRLKADSAAGVELCWMRGAPSASWFMFRIRAYEPYKMSVISSNSEELSSASCAHCLYIYIPYSFNNKGP